MPHSASTLAARPSATTTPRRIMVIYGTRAEAVKVAPVIRALAASPLFTRLVAVTAQHRSMLDQVSEVFGITPDFDLDIHQPGQTLTSITSRALGGVQCLLAEQRPDAVIVQGDTTTPVLVMRDTTERPEALRAGTVRLVGTDEDVIVDTVGNLLTDPAAYEAMASAINPYGDGCAAHHSVAALAHHFGLGPAADEFKATPASAAEARPVRRRTNPAYEAVPAVRRNQVALRGRCAAATVRLVRTYVILKWSGLADQE